MASTALVTGATGYLGSELVKQLLQKGFNVHATVRAPDNKQAVQHLLKLADALPGNVKLFKADLLQLNSFDDAVQGCQYVFHTASPFVIEVEDPQRDLLDPAVKGTSNVLKSVAKYKDAVRRTVVTSSVAAVLGNESAVPPKNGSLYTEDDWNDTSSIKNNEAYWLSKVSAEREAWKVAEVHGLDLVTVLPNFNLGPALSRQETKGLSVGFMKACLESDVIAGTPVVVDVRDVAKAHILAATIPSAKGRYIISQRKPITPKLVSDTLQARFPQFQIPNGEEAEAPDKIDNSKAAQELGLQVTPVEETLVDMAVTLIQLGIAKPRLKSV
ncbi:hypothetical protein ABBQ32_000577 [Trebouxia sp. C0010 RCD-2024]